jgi:peptidyl-prolyl cis-trans isomerase D
MLEMLRASLGSWVSKVFIGLLVASFALWGVADYATSSGSNVAISAGETKVGLDEYRFAFDRQVLLTSQQFGRRLTNEEARQFGVGEQVVGQLVTGAVLEEKARLMNLGLSDDELAESIGSDRAFQDASGSFNRRIFTQTLQNAGLTPNDFIELQKAVAVRQQLVNGSVESATPPAAFIEALKEHQTETRKISLITIGPDLVGEVADPSDSELEAFFAASTSRYRAPEYRTVRYMRATAQDLADLDQITEETAREEYERNIQVYTQPARRSIEQIVLTNEEQRETAEATLADGGDFDALVTALELNPAALNIGTFTRSNYPDANLREDVFTLPSGDTSAILDGAFGDVIIRATETQAELVEPFAAVRDSIREELAVGDAADAILDTLDKVEDARASGETLDAIAEVENLSVETITLDTSGRDTEGELAPNLIEAGTLIADVFETEVGVETDPIRLDATDRNPGGEGYIWYEVTDIAEARDRTLDEVRDRVIADWKEEKIGELVQATADGLAKRGKNGTEFATLAEPLGLEVDVVENVTRSNTNSGLSEVALAAVFDGVSGLVTTASGAERNQVLVLKAEATENSGIELPQEIQDRVNATFSDDLFAQTVARLQSELGPSVNQSAIQSIFSSSQHGGM